MTRISFVIAGKTIYLTTVYEKWCKNQMIKSSEKKLQKRLLIFIKRLLKLKIQCPDSDQASFSSVEILPLV